MEPIRAFNETNDLIYEGIATHVGTAHVGTAHVGNKRPDLRRDCDADETRSIGNARE